MTSDLPRAAPLPSTGRKQMWSRSQVWPPHTIIMVSRSHDRSMQRPSEQDNRKMALTTSFAVLIAFLGLLCGPTASADPGDYKDTFEAWRKEHGKHYSSEGEYQRRLNVFADNAALVETFNREGHSYEMGINEFSDLEFKEFQALYLQQPQDCSATRAGRVQVDYALLRGGRALPAAIDWRDRGVITPVKNQGQCGSCWTFSTTGCLEAHHAIKTGQLVSLSEQQLVDCAGAFNNKGCDGGLPSQAFEYIHYNGGLETEKDYPYKGKDGKCMFNKSEVAATVAAVHNVTQGDEDGIYQAVGTVGPVSIAFDVDAGFQMYKKGVYSSILCSKKPNHVNHAVLAVGYNTTDSGENYFIVKNSWGPSWGLNGYFWIVRGKNMCGLADCAAYPLV